MKLLILTQKIDKNDDILGFFHGWVEKLAQYCESIIVICLEKGAYNLPTNVRVLSLGKEEDHSRIKYLMNFYNFIWTEKNNYDTVFVHMNPEYVVLGGLLWKILNKKIFLWYNHKKGGLKTKIAGKLSKKIFYTSDFSFFAKSKKSQIMPAGIDTDVFKARSTKHEARSTILSLGRISPVKHIDILIDALKILSEKDFDFIANIYGDPTEKDIDYYNKTREMASDLEKKGKIVFYKGVSNYETPIIYNQNEIFVNLTPTGSFDKTILEAMACGCIPIVCNKSFEEIFNHELSSTLIFKESDPKDLSEKILYFFNLYEEKKDEIKRILWDAVVRNHNLDKLVKKLVNTISE